MGWRDIAEGVGRAIHETMKAGVDAVHDAKRSAKQNEGNMANAGARALEQAGKAMSKAGKALEKSAAASVRASRNRASTGSTFETLSGAIQDAALESSRLIGKGTDATGKLVTKSGRPLSTVTAGAIGGSVAFVSEAIDSVAIHRADLDELRDILAQQGEVALARSEQRRRRIDRAIKNRRKKELLDLYVVGGITLTQAVRAPDQVPEEVEAAFQAAYPGLANGESFAEAVSRMDSSELPGLVAGVKGKLFEQDFVDHLNSGNLPDGFTAHVADSANQPGWDINIVDADGNTVELLQAKATESLDYVKEALERYPDIDVVSTSEVYAQMMALGLAESVRDGGLTEAALEAKVMSAADLASGSVDATDLLPSAVGLAIIGLSVFMDKSLTGEQRAAEFGGRSGRVGVASVAAKGVMIATQTWWLGLVVGVGTGWLATKGRGKREQLEALKEVVGIVKKRERRIKRLGTQSA